jgi:hypothetical protein
MPTLPCIVGVIWRVPIARPMMRQLSVTRTSQLVKIPTRMPSSAPNSGVNFGFHAASTNTS